MSLPEQHLEAQNTIFKDSDSNSRVQKIGTKMWQCCSINFIIPRETEKKTILMAIKEHFSSEIKVTKSRETLEWKNIILIYLTEPHWSPRDKSIKQFPLQRNKQQRV